MAQDRLIERLHLAARHQHQHARPDLDQRARTEIARVAAPHRPGQREAPVGQPVDDRLRRERHAVRLATELQRHRRPLARRVAGRSALGIVDEAQHRPARPLPHQLGQQPGRIPMPAPARIILRVGDHDRTARPGLTQRGRHRLSRRKDLRPELQLAPLQLGKEPIRRRLRRRRRLGIGGEGRSAAGKIGIGKAKGPGQFGRAGLRHDPRPRRHDGRHWLDQRALAGDRQQIVELPERPRKRAAQRDPAQQQTHRPRPGRRHVDMRIGQVGREHVRPLDHRRRQVRVRVEARRHRRDAHDRPDPAQQLALQVEEGLADRRAVQIEIDAVERPEIQRPRQPGADHGRDPLERRVRHWPRRVGEPPSERHQLMPLRLPHLDRPAQPAGRGRAWPESAPRPP